MANFLQLCQAVARESGTVTGIQPATVTNQSGRLLKIVRFTEQAWQDIQNIREDWNWMLRQWSGNTLLDTEAYTAASWNISDLSRWAHKTKHVLFCKPQGADIVQQRRLTYVNWSEFRANLQFSVVDSNPPTHWSVRPGDNALMLSPKPDAVYELNGEYFKSIQTLVTDTDIPELPADHHNLIMWRALVLLHEHDEADDQAVRADRNYNRLLTPLLEVQLDDPEFGLPLA